MLCGDCVVVDKLKFCYVIEFCGLIFVVKCGEQRNLEDFMKL